MNRNSRAPSWRSLPIEKILVELKTDPAIGLSDAESQIRLRAHGSNQLFGKNTRSGLSIWLRQFSKPFELVLLFIALVLIIIEHQADSFIIFAILFLNSALGAAQEFRAHKTMGALKKLVPLTARVRRDGQEIVVPASTVVPGDILLLREGEQVVADARLISTEFLRLNESLLTGESLPVPKEASTISRSRNILHAPNMVFAGTDIIRGSALAVVVATGERTELGSISHHLHESRTPIPLEKDLRLLSRIVLVALAILLVVIGILAAQTGLSNIQIILFAVAVGLSAVPEGLPLILNIVLTSGLHRVAQHGALIKKLFAVEALGQAQVIALDKTGVLTLNQMSVVEVFLPNGAVVKVNDHISNLPELHTIAQFIPFYTTQDPTEAAIMRLHRPCPNFSTVAEQHIYPFDYGMRFSAAGWEINETDEQVVVLGAPEMIMEFCALTENERLLIARQAQAMAERGLRLVALATGVAAKRHWSQNDLPGMEWQCLFGLADTLRPEALDTIRRLKASGLRVVMITGDLPVTALAIAKEVEIFERGDNVLTGEDLVRLSENELKILLPKTTVFARVTPEDKLRLVELYEKIGCTVVMTGDGVNDAPALAAAHIGIATGQSGTDVARQAADIILLNDRLDTILYAIEEGRFMYVKLRKVIAYLFATNLGEIGIILTALLFGIASPLLAIQIVWLNLVIDGFLDVAMAMEPRENSSIPKPRRAKYLLGWNNLGDILLTAVTITAAAYALLWLNPTANPLVRQTIVLIAITFFLIMHAWNLRTERRSLLFAGWKKNPYLIAATAAVIVLQIAAVYFPPLQKLLGTTKVAGIIWLQAVAAALVLLLVEEGKKMWRRWQHPLHQI